MPKVSQKGTSPTVKTQMRCMQHYIIEDLTGVLMYNLIY